MAFVITQSCCKDARCVPVCPVDCIKPAPGNYGRASETDMLFIDPSACIECGACMEECPVDAILDEADLAPEQQIFKDLATNYFETHRPTPASKTARPHSTITGEKLKVAIVGTGPSACYAAAALVDIGGVEINFFEKLPTPFGLIRAGVAPDHQGTKQVADAFERVLSSARADCYFNVEVGRDIHHTELLEHHHAVVYATGATQGRSLGIRGEDQRHVHSAAHFVPWYNGHPDQQQLQVALNGKTAVVIGGGNVALDIARMLIKDRSALSVTDMADHALACLGEATIEEVVILARRGIRDASFSVGEFHELGNLDGVDIVIDSEDLNDRPDDDPFTAMRLRVARTYIRTAPPQGRRRIVFRFGWAPIEIAECDGQPLVMMARTNDPGVMDCLSACLVVTAIGFHVGDIPGLRANISDGAVLNVEGRVTGQSGPIPGTYVTGWAKRGPSGVIGSNRLCAAETVRALVEDFKDGRLGQPAQGGSNVSDLLRSRGVQRLTLEDWRTIDSAERRSGTGSGRARVKLSSVAAMLAAVGEIDGERPFRDGCHA